MSREREGFGGHESMKYQKKDRDFGGDKGRKKKKREEVKIGQDKNALERTDHGEKTPEAEIGDVLSFVIKKDEGDVNMTEMYKYIDWLKLRLNETEIDMSKEKFGNFEQITASVGAGGAGRQTSRNARARRHLITGIRATAEESRKAKPNEDIVMSKLEMRIKKHLDNWRLLLKGSGKSLENEIIDRIAELEKNKPSIWRVCD